MGRAFSRLGLLGNPSDGYGGKAIACPVRNFEARVSVTSGTDLTLSAGGAVLRWRDVEHAVDGPVPPEAEGLVRLMLGALRRLAGMVGQGGRSRGTITIECATTVPRRVGLAGSSAVIIATMRALCEHWGASVAPFRLAELALATEVQDLGIAAGPMDRVVQAYEQVMMMDLAPPRSEGSYRALDPSLIPPLLVAWVPTGGASSGITHSGLRQRFDRKDEDVLATMAQLRGVVDQGLDALEGGDRDRFADLVDKNFRLRCGVTAVSREDRDMVAIAQGMGAAAKLCGSGGAVVAVPRRGVALSDVAPALESAGFHTCVPRIS